MKFRGYQRFAPLVQQEMANLANLLLLPQKLWVLFCLEFVTFTKSGFKVSPRGNLIEMIFLLSCFVFQDFFLLVID